MYLKRRLPCYSWQLEFTAQHRGAERTTSHPESRPLDAGGEIPFSSHLARSPAPRHTLPRRSAPCDSPESSAPCISLITDQLAAPSFSGSSIDSACLCREHSHGPRESRGP